MTVAQYLHFVSSHPCLSLQGSEAVAASRAQLGHKQEAAAILETAAASCVGELEKFLIRIRALKVFLRFLTGV